MSHKHLQLPALAVLLGCTLLAGCQSRTDVSATGNTPAQFTHVFVTVNAIWFNTSATALATDTGWTQFTLTTPVTVDLVNMNNGTLGSIASSLKLSAGTYAQVMLVLADSTAALTGAAQSAGAATNDEVDYVDSLDLPHTVPLAVINAAQGISVGTSLTVAAASNSVGGSSSASTSTSTDTTASGSSTVSTPVVTTTSVIIDFDATRDLVPMNLSGQPAYALNPHPQTYDAKYSGTIQGAVDLTAVSTLTTAGLPDVQVAAEGVSTDGTRHVIVKTTRVGSDGTFILYPLSTASGAPTTYDLVIHGPTIETTIIKSVPVATSAPGSAAAALGTVSLNSANAFLVNLSTTTTATPSTSAVGFYQTLPLDAEVPYLIEARAIDPVTGRFAADQQISSGSLQYGSYLASGGTIAFTNVNPSQGASTYSVAAINPAYGAASFGTTVTAPATSNSVTALFTMTAPPVASGASANSITGTVSLSSPGTYDNAELFLTYNGALVAATSLNGYLGGSTALSLTGVAPGGSSSAAYAPGIYNAEVWAWNSTNPTGTLTRLPETSPIDMSAGNAAGVTLTVP